MLGVDTVFVGGEAWVYQHRNGQRSARDRQSIVHQNVPHCRGLRRLQTTFPRISRHWKLSVSLFRYTGKADPADTRRGNTRTSNKDTFGRIRNHNTWNRSTIELKNHGGGKVLLFVAR